MAATWTVTAWSWMWRVTASPCLYPIGLVRVFCQTAPDRSKSIWSPPSLAIDPKSANSSGSANDELMLMVSSRPAGSSVNLLDWIWVAFWTLSDSRTSVTSATCSQLASSFYQQGYHRKSKSANCLSAIPETEDWIPRPAKSLGSYRACHSKDGHKHAQFGGRYCGLFFALRRSVSSR